jgi:hypothetical protein
MFLDPIFESTSPKRYCQNIKTPAPKYESRTDNLIKLGVAENVVLTAPKISPHIYLFP